MEHPPIPSSGILQGPRDGPTAEYELRRFCDQEQQLFFPALVFALMKISLLAQGSAGRGAPRRGKGKKKGEAPLNWVAGTAQYLSCN